MASSLTKSTDLVRKLIVFFIIFAIFVFIFDFILALISPEERDTPLPRRDNKGYVEANNALGTIPRFPVRSLTLAPDTRASYALTSALPEFPPTVNVYRIDRPTETFLSVPNALKTAAALGFDPDQYQNTSDDVLFWSTPNSTRTLTYNKVLEDWLLEVNLATDPAAQLDDKELVTIQDFYKQAAVGIIGSLGPESGMFSTDTVRVDYIDIDASGNYTRFVQPTDARYARVALFKALESSSLVENYQPREGEVASRPVTSEVRKTAYMSAPAELVLQGSADEPDEDILSYKYREFLPADKGVYTLINPETAWNNVQANLGYLYWLRPEDRDVFDPYEQVVVTRFDAQPEKTRIIYLEPDNWDPNLPYTQFLQPFYIFEGIARLQDGREAEFAFIVEALNNSSYNNGD
ncbi:MAG: hypothetical protein TR69_WS6001000510 [candidate division WS6 bacterium OLB20]|uniref:Uncharacterized protein n=1 Tax=candidate division WS6 bacterium OLB20 TaxID=1617426 RepID=A0A136LY05_9BACT|nr:MAG: hypothetical protein TR69_WS6001000510 [candidate division WS6 bacterium OLB20]